MLKPINTVCCIGLGYIGLPTAALIASRGTKVIGVDINPEVVKTINKGKVHIVEADLEALVQKVVSNGTLKAHLEYQPADAFLLSVPTPFKNNHVPDLSYIEEAAGNMAPVLEKGNLIIIESTVPVGTTAHIAALLAKLRPDLKFPQMAGELADIQIAYCPERVLPGRILTELVQNDRSIGGMTPHCARRAKQLYEIFLDAECLITDASTAELVKLSENAFRDINIAFANELSMICDHLDINVWDVVQLANRHPRVNILQPGPGVGGHCIAVDPWFIIHSAPRQAALMRLARQVNEGKTKFVLDQINNAAKLHPEAVIACLGLAYKPDIDDFRESPALIIARNLAKKHGERLLVVEPYIAELPSSLTETGACFVDASTALKRADIVVLLVDHKQFREIEQSQLDGKVIIDTKGLWHNYAFAF